MAVFFGVTVSAMKSGLSEVVVRRAKARDKALDAKRQLADGVDPSAAKRQRDGDALTFAQVALAWHTEKRPAWSEKHADRLLRRMEVDLFPFIGALPIAQVGANEVEQVLKRVAAHARDGHPAAAAGTTAKTRVKKVKLYKIINIIENQPANKYHRHHTITN